MYVYIFNYPELFFIFIKKITFYLFILRGVEREKEMERSISVREKIDQLPLVCAPARDRTGNPGMCPDQELNQPLTLQNDVQPTEPHLSGPELIFKKLKYSM